MALRICVNGVPVYTYVKLVFYRIRRDVDSLTCFHVAFYVRADTRMSLNWIWKEEEEEDTDNLLNIY